MIRDSAIRVLAEFVTVKLTAEPITDQIRLYQALAEVMPTDEERESAEQIGITLSRAAALQLDFTNQLFRLSASVPAVLPAEIRGEKGSAMTVKQTNKKECEE